MGSRVCLDISRGIGLYINPNFSKSLLIDDRVQLVSESFVVGTYPGTYHVKYVAQFQQNYVYVKNMIELLNDTVTNRKRKFFRSSLL